MEQWWEWAEAHPAEAAWIVLGALSALVVAYKPLEPRLKAWAGRTPNRVDDKVIAGLSHALALLTLLLDLVRQLVPHGVSRTWTHSLKRGSDGEEEA